jgi:hypothetical protein
MYNITTAAAAARVAGEQQKKIIDVDGVFKRRLRPTAVKNLF